MPELISLAGSRRIEIVALVILQSLRDWHFINSLIPVVSLRLTTGELLPSLRDKNRSRAEPTKKPLPDPL